jgi:hypothetical protein
MIRHGTTPIFTIADRVRSRNLRRRQPARDLRPRRWKSIIQAAWRSGVPKVALDPPSPQARRQLASVPTDLGSGKRQSSRHRRVFVEYLRLNERGQIKESRFRLVRGEKGLRERSRRRMVARPSNGLETAWPTFQQSTSGWGGYSGNSSGWRW